jgi:hypothetical protein
LPRGGWDGRFTTTRRLGFIGVIQVLMRVVVLARRVSDLRQKCKEEQVGYGLMAVAA